MQKAIEDIAFKKFREASSKLDSIRELSDTFSANICVKVFLFAKKANHIMHDVESFFREGSEDKLTPYGKYLLAHALAANGARNQSGFVHVANLLLKRTQKSNQYEHLLV